MAAFGALQETTETESDTGVDSASNGSTETSFNSSIGSDEQKYYHFDLLNLDKNGQKKNVDTAVQLQNEAFASPLLSSKALIALQHPQDRIKESRSPQYALIAGRETGSQTESDDEVQTDPRLFQNISCPASAFICGSQGSGKSHTLSCILENCMIQSQRLGQLRNPLPALLFHYDPTSSQPCEAAYLASAKIPVKVLASSTSFWTRSPLYKSVSSNTDGESNIEVYPFAFPNTSLTSEHLLKLMAVDDKEGNMPLYMEALCKVVRDQAEASRGGPLDYRRFKLSLDNFPFDQKQRQMLNLRLGIVDSFVNVPREQLRGLEKGRQWGLEQGGLTIIDMSSAAIDKSTACLIFDIALDIMLSSFDGKGIVIGLDEAHKYMNDSGGSESFTDRLLHTVRLQRHYGARVIVFTQEPTISPKLLDLCSLTIVHRFTSPDWMRVLQSHLAGASAVFLTDDDGAKASNGKERVREIFKQVVELNTGQALIFGPTVMIDDATQGYGKLGTDYLKVKIRNRITQDGGMSVVAE